MNILIRPIITEKSMRDAAKNCYTFAVLATANKAEISREISTNFGVKTLSVRTVVVKGKTKRAGKRRGTIQTAPWKKAVIEIEAGKKIDLFDVTETEHKHA